MNCKHTQAKNDLLFFFLFCSQKMICFRKLLIIAKRKRERESLSQRGSTTVVDRFKQLLKCGHTHTHFFIQLHMIEHTFVLISFWSTRKFVKTRTKKRQRASHPSFVWPLFEFWWFDFLSSWIPSLISNPKLAHTHSTRRQQIFIALDLPKAFKILFWSKFYLRLFIIMRSNQFHVCGWVRLGIPLHIRPLFLLVVSTVRQVVIRHSNETGQCDQIWMLFVRLIRLPV